MDDLEKQRDLDASDLKPPPPGHKFSLWFYCDNCKALTNHGVELKNRTDDRQLRICPNCAYNLKIVSPETAPEIWRKMGIRQ